MFLSIVELHEYRVCENKFQNGVENVSILTRKIRIYIAIFSFFRNLSYKILHWRLDCDTFEMRLCTFRFPIRNRLMILPVNHVPVDKHNDDKKVVIRLGYNRTIQEIYLCARSPRVQSNRQPCILLYRIT